MSTDLNKIEHILETVSGLTVLEVCSLVKAMEEKFGVSAAAPVAVAAPAAAAAPVEEQTEFNVTLAAYPASSKIEVIKRIRELLGLGIKEAKDMVDSAPCVVKAGASKDEAAKIKASLSEAGATVEVK